MSEAMREAFEAHYFSCHGGGNMTFDHANSYYLDSDVNDYWLAFQAGEQTALSANGGACPSCNGSGTTEVLSDNSPDAYGVDVDCPDCSGTGANAEDDGWHGKPVCPGRYEVRGFDHFGTVGVVSVAVEGGELVCNLHDSSTAEIDEYSYYLSDIDEDFEWRTLYTHPAPPSVAVPEGWRLVPVEPTTEMLGEGAIALFAQSREPLSSAYRSMLAAAPRCPMLTAAPSGDAKREADELRKDAERYQWLRNRIFAADFDYGGLDAPCLIIAFPKGSIFTSDANETIDAARLRQSSDGDDSEGVE